jgi:hypothetical protein
LVDSNLQVQGPQIKRNGFVLLQYYDIHWLQRPIV